jgi:hypothetical protein
MISYVSTAPPELRTDEFELRRVRPSTRMFIGAGIGLFIPPFVFGVVAIVLCYWLYISRELILTNQRLLLLERKFNGSYQVTELPLTEISSARPIFNSAKMMFGLANLRIWYDDGHSRVIKLGPARIMPFVDFSNCPQPLTTSAVICEAVQTLKAS